jgi:hypothetical protein
MAVAVPLIAAGVSAAGSALSGYLSRHKESKTDQRKRELIDDLLASVKGNGPYSDMFKTSEADFNKSYVQPAKARFRNQIAPQIQQEYIYNGQQNGTGLEDTLTRAGVDLDQMLNEQYLNYVNQGNTNKQNTINSILGSTASKPSQSGLSAAGQGVAGYSQSDTFGNQVGDILKAFKDREGKNTPPAAPERAGFWDFFSKKNTGGS